MPTLAVWAPEDGLLGALAPLGLALARPSCLVVDLDEHGPRWPGDRALADLVEDGARRDDLTPGPGVAVLRNGGVAASEAAGVVRALADAWPDCVLRLPPRPEPPLGTMPIVPVHLLVPGGLFPAPDGRAVYQATPAWSRMPGPGIRLPVPRRTTVAALAGGRRPPGRDPWVSAWRRVWEQRWER